MKGTNITQQLGVNKQYLHTPDKYQWNVGQNLYRSCYGLPVRLPYIVITCARIGSIKRVCSELPCCPGAFSDLLSIHDNLGDEDRILGIFYCRKSGRNS